MLHTLGLGENPPNSSEINHSAREGALRFLGSPFDEAGGV
jgi:hypothetical protein